MHKVLTNNKNLKKEAQPATRQVVLLFLRFHYNFVRYISK